MQARLVVHQEDQEIGCFVLDDSQQTTIGRHPDCTFCFQDTKISTRHCFLEPKGNYFYIMDQNSTNGTYVNGSRIRVRRLYNGDVIQLGAVQLCFEWIPDKQSEQDVVCVDLKEEEYAKEAVRTLLPEKKQKRIGDYIVLKKIGQGGIGEVYKAEHTTAPEMPVAIKVLTATAQQKPTLVERFLREAKACLELSHPRIVKVFEIGISHNRPYFVMEYLAGQTLEKFIRQHGALSLKNTLKIAGHIAHGLYYAHNHNIIHRDLKPANILLEEPNYNVKLIDLGLAKMLSESRLTITHHLIGTPRYMAPEQMLNPNEIDFRADIYSLGACMYHMVTGMAPYAEIISENQSVLLRYMYTKRPMPIEKLVDIPKPLVDLIEKAMSKHKEDRFADADQMFQAIRSLLKNLSEKEIL